MPSKSKSQQRLFGMVTAFKKGELDTADMPENLADKVKSISKSISKKAARDFAKTDTKGKPEHVTETLSFKDFLDVVELSEKWAEEADVPESKKGMFKGRSKADLEAELAKLKKSGPHKEGSPEYTKEKELMFAIRAKSGWKSID